MTTHNPLADDHFLHDLAATVASTDERHTVVTHPLNSYLLDPSGAPSMGILGTIIDIAGGFAAIGIAEPDWVSTSNLDIHRLGRRAVDELSARTSVLRNGASRIILSVEVSGTDSEGTHPVATATMSFAGLKRRRGTPTYKLRPGEQPKWLTGGPSRYSKLLFDQIGLVDQGAGVVSLQLSTYVRNSSKVLQGGSTAILAEAGALSAARAQGASAPCVTDMMLRYLAPARVGPFVTDSTQPASDRNLKATNIRLLDSGAGNRLVAWCSALVDPGS